MCFRRLSLEPQILIGIGIPWLLSELYWYHFSEELAFNVHSWKKRGPQTANLLQKIKESYYLRGCWLWKSGRNECKLGNSIFLWIGAVISRDRELGKGTQRNWTETALVAMKPLCLVKPLLCVFPREVRAHPVLFIPQLNAGGRGFLWQEWSSAVAAESGRCSPPESLVTSVPIAVLEIFGYCALPAWFFSAVKTCLSTSFAYLWVLPESMSLVVLLNGRGRNLEGNLSSASKVPDKDWLILFSFFRSTHRIRIVLF